MCKYSTIFNTPFNINLIEGGVFLMRVLILRNTANGIINIKDYEYFVIDNVTDFRQIITELVSMNKSQFDFKYCILEENEFIPFFMNVKNKLYNQMQEFSFDRVKYSDLAVSEDQKEAMIKQVVIQKNTILIQQLEKQGISLLLKREFGNEVNDDFLKVGEEIEKLENEIKDINYKNYLDEYV
jgi:hypothetical protein